MHRVFTFITLVLIDLIIVTSTPYLALLIRFDGDVDIRYVKALVSYMPLIIIVSLLVFYLFRLYQRLWRYAGVNELVAIVGAATTASSIISGYMYFSFSGLPRTMYVLSWVFNIVLLGASRVLIRMLYYWQLRNRNEENNVLIIGAGDAGAMIAREINQRYSGDKKIVGFIDDAGYKFNQRLFGVKVLGKREDIERVVREQAVNEIIIAMPSVGGRIIREIVNECKKTSCSVKIAPGIYEVIDGKVSLQQLRNVDVEDLLRRDSVQLDIEQIACYLTGKRVLVTGAGGSIGSELCRQISKMSPEKLILLGKGENSIYEIHRELYEKSGKQNIEAIIADVRDVDRINSVFAEYKPQVVFHAAAHKHVPLMETQPVEAVRNNIFGTKTVAEAADRIKAEIFVMISTDKAVNPTSVMGATKRVAELVIQSMSHISTTKYVAVRFGNVLGSRGSVIPLFKRQIANGGPITITHPDMKRYFMTIPEASQLVLQAGALANGGEVFVLDMGDPVNITDLAYDLIKLSGLEIGKDIQIKYTGLRPGEKLFEELLTAEEGTSATKHEKIYHAILKSVDDEKLYTQLLKLRTIEDEQLIREILHDLVPTYNSSQDKREIYNGDNIATKRMAKLDYPSIGMSG